MAPEDPWVIKDAGKVAIIDLMHVLNNFRFSATSRANLRAPKRAVKRREEAGEAEVVIDQGCRRACISSLLGTNRRKDTRHTQQGKRLQTALDSLRDAKHGDPGRTSWRNGRGPMRRVADLECQTRSGVQGPAVGGRVVVFGFFRSHDLAKWRHISS